MRLHKAYVEFFVNHFIRPQFDSLGKHLEVMSPKKIKIHGRNIRAGDFLHLIAAADKPINIITWSDTRLQGHINIGDYCLISPGVFINSAERITIGDNCMFAADCYISDCDWHGLYNRTRPFYCTKPINIADNVWVGHGAKIGKGVSIGENSVIAAGSVVVKDVPANVVVGGNPAQVVKTINPNRHCLKREALFVDERCYLERKDQINRYALGPNKFFHWIRTLIYPKVDD